MEIDIRPQPAVPVTSVRFADEDETNNLIAVAVEIGVEKLFITGSGSDPTFVALTSREHATDLIKALGKAIDVKWPPTQKR